MFCEFKVPVLVNAQIDGVTGSGLAAVDVFLNTGIAIRGQQEAALNVQTLIENETNVQSS